MPSAGGSGNFGVTVESGCAWSAISNAAWITTTSNGNGNGAVNFTVAANTGVQRSGTITVGGQTFTINQAAAPPVCTNGVSVALPVNASAAPGSILTVPITVGSVTGRNVISYDFVVTFDPNVIRPVTGSPVNTTGTLSSNFVVTPNPNVPGQLTVSAFGTTALSGWGRDALVPGFISALIRGW